MTAVKTSNEKTARLWGSGGREYEIISQAIGPAILHGVERLAPQPGERILDVGTGTGRAAREVAVRGASVVAVDISEELLDGARELSGPSQNPIDYRLADAEVLPFEDSSFDRVLSSFGVIFSAEPFVAAGELARVLRPGGRLVVLAWTPESNAGAMRQLTAPFAPPPPEPAPPPPHAWGTEEGTRDYLGSHFELSYEYGAFDFRQADGATAWRAFVAGFGPVKMVAHSLDEMQRGELARSFSEWCDQFRTGVGLSIPFEYLVTIGQRR